MPSLKPCLVCGRLTSNFRCPDHSDNKQRAARNNTNGTHRSHWRNLRAAVLERDGHQCRLRADDRCTMIATTVHLNPSLNGDHDRATANDCLSACAHCHGVTDAPRAAGR